MGSVMDLMPSQTIKINVPQRKSDLENLQGDWQRVGGDMSRAINQFDDERKKRST